MLEPVPVTVLDVHHYATRPGVRLEYVAPECSLLFVMADAGIRHSEECGELALAGISFGVFMRGHNYLIINYLV